MNLNELKSGSGREKFFNMMRYEPGAKKPKRVPMKRLRKMYYEALDPLRLKERNPEQYAKLVKLMPKAMEEGMRASASHSFLRTSARKMGAVMQLVRGKSVTEARAILQFTNKKAARLLEKVLENASATADAGAEFDEDRLYVANAAADQGPTIPRVRPMSMGRVGRIRKRTCAAHIELKQRPEAAKPARRKAATTGKPAKAAKPRKEEKK